MEKTLCFTGHRPPKIGGYDTRNATRVAVKQWLAAAVDQAISEGYTRFISGGALGVDQDAFWLVHDAKNKHSGLTNELAIPCVNQECRWPEASREAYHRMLKCADVTNVLAESYDPGVMQARNVWMVDHSEMVIAVWDGSPGGTANCVMYTRHTYPTKQVLVYDPRTDKSRVLYG